MKKFFFSFLILIGAPGFITHLHGQTSERNLYPAGLYPDRIYLNVTEDPSTSIAVSWRTNAETQTGELEIVEASADPQAIKNARKQQAVTEYFSLKNIEANYHSVKMGGLSPNTLYMYRVGAGEYWSEWFHVRTSGKAGEKFSLIYFGDVQAGMRSLWPRVIRKAYTHAPDAKLIMYAGDIVNRGFNDHEWGELFYGGSFIHGSVPGMPSPGNHEHADNAEGVNVITSIWHPQFALPDNGPEGLKETVYYADIQGVRFISLNSQAIWFGGEMMQRQINWLHKILKNNPNQWTFVIFHHPVHSVNIKRDNKNLRENFQPIFDQYKVDLVLQGHDHAYGRGMKKIKQADNKTPSNTMYVVSMSGSKMYEKVEREWMDKAGGNIQLYQIITIDGNKLSYDSYGATGELFDAFDLIKRKGNNNRLVNRK